MFFETAGIEVALWLPPLVAFAISFLTCMGGVSGAFLLLPFQVSVLGFATPAVSATNQLFNATSIPAGVYRYWREGRMVWPLTAVIVAGTVPGVVLGALIRVTWMPDPSRFKLFAAAVLAYVGLRLFRDLVGRRGDPQAAGAEEVFRGLARRGALGRGQPSAARTIRLTWTRLEYDFLGERCHVSVPALTLLSLAVGIVGGAYGIGGGAIIAPFLVSFYSLPVYTVAGPVLAATFITSAAGVAVFQALAPLHPGLAVAPDWLLGLLFGVGGMAGMYLGARAQKRVPARTIKWLLAGIVAVAVASLSAQAIG